MFPLQPVFSIRQPRFSDCLCRQERKRSPVQTVLQHPFGCLCQYRPRREINRGGNPDVFKWECICRLQQFSRGNPLCPVKSAPRLAAFFPSEQAVPVQQANGYPFSGDPYGLGKSAFPVRCKTHCRNGQDMTEAFAFKRQRQGIRHAITGRRIPAAGIFQPVFIDIGTGDTSSGQLARLSRKPARTTTDVENAVPFSRFERVDDKPKFHPARPVSRGRFIPCVMQLRRDGFKM